jgi:hypothetical protein
MFLKIGENLNILKIESPDSVEINQAILDNFNKTASELKRIAPKADDFLYFSAVMMHSAEASALNEDGSYKLNLRGEPVKVGWDTSNNTWRWKTNDPMIKPYKNLNGDIFPESELIKVHKNWIGKPLCIDHKSSSVDHVRGFIVDTYYDRALKRVVAFCALDKKNYPELARKVSSGYSNCVSMGTGVGKAICSDCAQVARTEADFCHHMRSKSCYGEINTELNPIELSIVVNGADPQAKIKHVMAMAQNLNNYIDQKEKELKKLAGNKRYIASFSMEDTEREGLASTNLSVESTDLNSFKSDIEDALNRLSELNEDLSNENENSDTNHLISNQSSGRLSMDEESLPSNDSSLAPPTDKFATINDLKILTHQMAEKLNHINKSLEHLVASKEETMPGKGNDLNKNAYYQGTEEPTPGQVKYPKDPLNEKARAEDKHMVGQMDTGPVDGMHPGVDSVPMSEFDRKKMLARAQADERSMRRTAIVEIAKQNLENKKAYFQNGDGKDNPGTPTPGKPKYPVDKLNEQAREQDKHMVGQKPFPGVGAVDGLHPSPASADTADELKRKEMLSRASLRARFVKAANEDGSQNLGKSAWEVFLGDKLLVAASVNDLSGNKADFLYDSIATKDFGTKLIDKVKVFGADKVRSMIKSAQEMPAAPSADMSAMPASEPSSPEPMDDQGGNGDMSESAKDMAQQIENLASDLKAALDTVDGDVPEMGDVAPVTASLENSSFDLKALNQMKKEINSELSSKLKEVIAHLQDHKDELKMLDSAFKSSLHPDSKNSLKNILASALVEMKETVVEANELYGTFVKYARGSQAIMKRAQVESQLKALSDEDHGHPMNEETQSDLMNLINSTNEDLANVEDMLNEDDDNYSSDAMTGADALLQELEMPSEDLAAADDDKTNEDENDADGLVTVKNTQQAAEVAKQNPNAHVAVASLDSKAGRAALRAKLAAGDGMKFSPMLDQAHPKGGVTPADMGKTEGDLSKVETLDEVSKKMNDLAKAPVKVRKEAEAIHNLISEGKLREDELDSLVAQGLDKDAVAYYKKYYGQTDGGSEFASELVKEHSKAYMENDLNVYKVKLSRAYELAYDMVSRGLVYNDPKAITAQVEEIMQCNDEGFESLKRVVAKQVPNLQTQAGRMPQVGAREFTEVPSLAPTDMKSQFDAHFSRNRPKRMF